MTIRPKTQSEIDAMIEGGRILSLVHESAFRFVKPGQTLKEIDDFIHKQIVSHGAAPSFLNYHGYPAASCLSINDVVVHGIPSDYKLTERDILGIDIGVHYEGYHTDAALTMPLGSMPHATQNLLAVTQAALEEGIAAAVAGNTVADISDAIHTYVESQGNFGIVRDLCGHGVGANLQEEPEIPNYRHRNTTPLVNGMTLAIEPMITLGDWKVTIDKDDWTVRTKDHSLAAQFETTVVIRDNDPIILVPFTLSSEILKPR